MSEMNLLIERAKRFAQFAHAGQVRKYTGEPYWHHPRNVARMVQAELDAAEQDGYTEWENGDEMVAAAWLHDTVEDTAVTLDDINRLFGRTVRELVAQLTDVFTSKAYPQCNREERKRREAHRLAIASPEARLIKRCDMIDNTSSIVEHDPGFAVVYLREKVYLLELLNEADRTDRIEHVTVRSFTEPATDYEVTVHGNGDATCTCPHFRFRKERCKHIIRATAV